MGICSVGSSAKFPPGWTQLFTSLKLSRSDVNQLYKMFCKVDLDGSGSVDTVELLTLLDIERTRFTEQIFAVFDNDGSGKVDFREFVMSLWNYCTIGQAALEIFTFDMYDADSSGVLSPAEVSRMLTDVYGSKHANDPKMKMVLAELEKIDSSTGINLPAFKKFTKTHQGLLFPVFNLQHQLRTSVLGTSFWERASDRRVELSKGQYVTMSDLMLLHLNQGLYERAVSDSNLLRMTSNARLVIKATGTNQRRQSTDAAHHTKNIGPPTVDSPRDDPNKGTANSAAGTRRSSTASTAGAGGGTSSTNTSTSTAVDAPSSAPAPQETQNLSHGFGSSFLLGGVFSSSRGAPPPSSKKKDGHHHHGHHHGHGHHHAHGHHTHSILKSTAAAADGTDIYFDSSGKKKPVHATGHHQCDVNAVKHRSVAIGAMG